MNSDDVSQAEAFAEQQRRALAGPKAPKGIEATEADIGRKVIYRTAPNFEPEEGVITSIGRIGNVFVRYGAQCTSQSTDMGDLDWMMP